MMDQTEQLFPVSAIQQRYGIGKQTAINRRKFLDIKPIKQGSNNYITEADLERLDQLDIFLKNNPNAKMSDFLDQNNGQITQKEEGTITEVSMQEIMSLITLVTEKMETKKEANVLSHWEELEKAHSNQWLLTTSEIHQLTGAKPKGKQWTRGRFTFVEAGKIGAEKAWEVWKS